MSDRIHRILMFVGAGTVLVSGILGGSQLVDPVVTAWIGVVGAIATGLATTWRVYFPQTTTTTTTPPVTGP